jgi:hypothetical protein
MGYVTKSNSETCYKLRKLKCSVGKSYSFLSYYKFNACNLNLPWPDTPFALSFILCITGKLSHSNSVELELTVLDPNKAISKKADGKIFSLIPGFHELIFFCLPLSPIVLTLMS